MAIIIDQTTDLELLADALGQYCWITFTDIGNPLIAGELYRFTYDHTEILDGWERMLLVHIMNMIQ